MKTMTKWGIGVGGAVLVAIAAFSVYSSMQSLRSSLPSAETPAAKPAVNKLEASVVYLEGAVEYKKPESDWIRLNADRSLGEGDSIETLNGGRAILRLDDGSVLRLNEQSRITLTSLDPSNVEIANEGGELYSRVVKLDRTFRVVAGQTTYESLGTAYKTVMTKDKEGVEVYHSKVKVTEASKDVVVNEGSAFYLKNGEDAALEKKVTEIDTKEMEGDEFLAWNKEEDQKEFENEMGVLSEKSAEVKDAEAATKSELADSEKATNDEAAKEVTQKPTAVTGALKLAYKLNGNVAWTYDGTSPNGFKLVWSKSQNPTYPLRDGDKYKYYSEPSVRAGSVFAFDGGGTYYIRVCTYVDGKCGTYSNQIQATFLDQDPVKTETTKTETTTTTGKVDSITLSVTSPKVFWAVNGYSEKGFKVIWSKNANPTYPTRDGDMYVYLSDPGAASQQLKAFDGPGTYYVRVCEYLGGACGVYSNQVQIQF